MVGYDATSDADTFARNLTSLLQLPDASKVQGLVIGGSGKRAALPAPCWS